MPKILLSAALIVRDEAKYLDDCLVSLRGIVDETVIVDTGSIDDTKAIAARQGARIADFPWCDDFAAARNHALDLARGRWILYIDADERVRCPDPAALRASLEDPRFVALYVLFHVHPGYTPYHEVRLFRNDPRIRFEGIIHETVWPGIRRQVLDGNGHIGPGSLELVHLGYIGDLQHKVGRNLPLLERAVANDPTRIYLWCELAKAYDLVGRQADADRMFRKALTLARTATVFNPIDSVAYTDSTRWRVRRGKPIDRLVAEGLRRFPSNKQLLWLHACRLMERRNFKKAAAVIERVLGEREPDNVEMTVGYDRRIFGVFGREALATCHFKLGRYAEAVQHFALAVAEQPDNQELRRKAQMAGLLALGKTAGPPPGPASG